MTNLASDHNQYYTYENYQSWPDNEHWEIIEGEAFNMSPAPSTRHQLISGNLFGELRSYFKNKKCQVFPAPTDVKLSDTDIVQPDILVVCNLDQIKISHIENAPSLIIEILSPYTEMHDRVRKMRLYAKYGVKEYWIVTPFPSMIEVFLLKNNKYILFQAYAKNEILQSVTFKKLSIVLSDIFTFPLKPEEEKIFLQVKEPPAEYGR